MHSRRTITWALPAVLAAAILSFLLFASASPLAAVGSVVKVAAGGDTVFSAGVYSLNEGQTGSITFDYQGPGAAAVGQRVEITIGETTITQDETVTVEGVDFTPRKTGFNQFAVEIDAVRSVVPPLSSAQ